MRVTRNELRDGIVAAALGRIGVDLNDRWQGHAVVLGLVAAQARTDDNEQVGACIDFYRLARHIEGAETAQVTFRHDGAAVGAGDDAEAAIDQGGRGISGAAGAAAEP